MKVDIYMPLYVADYLSDTGDLQAEEHGAYLLLLMAAWKRDGRLPIEPDRLAKLASIKPNRWDPVWKVIGRFFTREGDQYVQGRLARELEISKGKKLRASAKGKKGAEARYGHSPGNGTGSAKGIAVALPGLQLGHSSSTSPSEEEAEKREVTGSDPLTVNGLIWLIRVAVEKHQPRNGLYVPGNWAIRNADVFLSQITPDRFNDETRTEIKARIETFARSSDQRFSKKGWSVEVFTENYSALGKIATNAPPTDLGLAEKYGAKPYLPKDANGAG